jgi:hypothetical protein
LRDTEAWEQLKLDRNPSSDVDPIVNRVFIMLEVICAWEVQL